MRIPKLPFHNIITEMLYTLFFQGECIFCETMIVSDFYPSALSIPEHARYALMIVEADPLQYDKDLVVRFCEDGQNAQADFGMPLGHMGVYEVKGSGNMDRFTIIGIELGRHHKVRIQYFG